MDQPLTITEKEVTRFATNDIKQSALPAAITQIKHQQQLAAIKQVWKPDDPRYGEQDTLSIERQYPKRAESRAGLQRN